MPFSRLPLCSSRELIAALERLGCYPGRAEAGSHVSYLRRVSGDRVATAVVVLGKREVPKGTLQSILRGLQIETTEFLDALH